MDQTFKRITVRRHAVDSRPSDSTTLPAVKRPKTGVSKTRKKVKSSTKNKNKVVSKKDVINNDKIPKEKMSIKTEPNIDTNYATVDQTVKDKNSNEDCMFMVEIPINLKEEFVCSDNNVEREEMVVSEGNTIVEEADIRNIEYSGNEDFANQVTVNIISVKTIKDNKQIQTEESTMFNKIDVNTQTNDDITKITTNTAAQTDPIISLNRKNKKIQTKTKFTKVQAEAMVRMELLVDIQKKDEETQFEVIKFDKEIQTDLISEKNKKDKETQTEEVKIYKTVQTSGISTSLQELRRPFQMKSVNYARLVDVYILFPFYQAIEVVENAYWSLEKKRKFPTEWLQLTNPYWDEFRTAANKEELYNTKQFISSHDEATVWVQEKWGVVYAIRHGFKVIIRYPDGGNGGRYQYDPLPEVYTDGAKVTSKGFLWLTYHTIVLFGTTFS